jgi:hypothetical protein
VKGLTRRTGVLSVVVTGVSATVSLAVPVNSGMDNVRRRRTYVVEFNPDSTGYVAQTLTRKQLTVR